MCHVTSRRRWWLWKRPRSPWQSRRSAYVARPRASWGPQTWCLWPVVRGWEGGDVLAGVLTGVREDVRKCGKVWWRECASVCYDMMCSRMYEWWYVYKRTRDGVWEQVCVGGNERVSESDLLQYVREGGLDVVPRDAFLCMGERVSERVSGWVSGWVGEWAGGWVNQRGVVSGRGCLFEVVLRGCILRRKIERVFGYVLSGCINMCWEGVLILSGCIDIERMYWYVLRGYTDGMWQSMINQSPGGESAMAFCASS